MRVSRTLLILAGPNGAGKTEMAVTRVAQRAAQGGLRRPRIRDSAEIRPANRATSNTDGEPGDRSKGELRAVAILLLGLGGDERAGYARCL